MLLPHCGFTCQSFNLLRVRLDETCATRSALYRISKTTFTGDLHFRAIIAIRRIICIIESLFRHLIFQRGAIILSQLLTHALTSTSGTLLNSVSNRTLEWVWRTIIKGSSCGLYKGTRGVLVGSLCEPTVIAGLSGPIFIEDIRADLPLSLIALPSEGIRLAWNCWGQSRASMADCAQWQAIAAILGIYQARYILLEASGVL